MKKIIVFSGTTEGRQLSDMLTAEEIRHTVCVASEYGRDVMRRNPFAEIQVGRMNADEMIDFFKEQELAQEDIVVDATHPFATQVTANIKEAADFLGVSLLRIIREEDRELPDDAVKYSDINDCARAINETEGNILLTTGSKELSQYCRVASKETLDRTYVRVLPSVDSIKICESENIESDHILAMQGPFSKELNEALIAEYDIKHLITKESGVAGGFLEKKAAAVSAGIKLHVIERPYSEDGVSVESAFMLITGKKAMDNPDKTPASIFLIGIGMGTAASMTQEAKEAIQQSEAIFGADRLIKSLSCSKKYPMYLSRDIIPVLEKENIHSASIVFSGDTSFYSGSKKMLEALKEWRSELDIQVIPGISSFSYLSAILGESYEDACLFSLHGKNTEKDYRILADKVLYNRKAFVLLSGAEDVSVAAKRLLDLGVSGRIVVGLNLSYENERIIDLSLEEAASFDEKGIATAFIENMNPLRRPLIPVKRDSDFIRDKVPMTKECVRHESIIRLGLREGDVFYDIGGGTGSVAIEAASLSLSLQVYTLEMKREAVELIKKNIKESDAPNVTVLEGNAAELLGDMQRPDCVFIGGSGGKLQEIVDILHTKGEGIRYVINAVSLETIEEVREIIKKYEPDDEETVMISVSCVEKIGSYHMLQGQNPIWITSFTI
ncbi:precorrin-6Y C5,15-methyltransferase (decarboxylating) [Lachnospiraceae bacterium NE2001]|nr:precorrin-6Y C5,15-methyltransferase (decarboxylating) [Lachnospiraceae bacterium NE2001]